MREHLRYLKTLRRVPDDIILSVASRPLNLADGKSCLCGWVVREAMLRLGRTETEAGREVEADTGTDWWMNSSKRAQGLFGGTSEEWGDIYSGVVDREMPDIELAFTHRVAEAANG